MYWPGVRREDEEPRRLKLLTLFEVQTGRELCTTAGFRYLRCLRFRQGALYPRGFEILRLWFREITLYPERFQIRTLFEVQTGSFVPQEVRDTYVAEVQTGSFVPQEV